MRKQIEITFPISEQEYNKLNDQFGNLVEHASWELLRKNTRNNHTLAQEDIAQELRIAMLRSASYYKRQVYIEAALELCEKHAADYFIKEMISELKRLWDNKTKHGAGRQKFGDYQEVILDRLVSKLIPVGERPSKTAPLKIDPKFERYCKSICWNGSKNLGKKITRERAIRHGMASLSSFDYLGVI